jgi:type 1 glutamine amidotransferase
MAFANSTNSDIKVAVITGNHPFEVPQFINFFRNLDGIDCYVQDLENFAADMADIKHEYDVLLFYNMHGQPPADQATRRAIERLGETKQGLFLLHHAILGFADWHIWSAIVGIENRKFTYHPGETVKVDIVDANHPITAGLSAWEMMDETYRMEGAGEGSQILLGTQHPKSLKTLAWTRQYRNAPVFCFASGHGKDTWADPNFRTVVERGIHWLAGKR